MKKSELLKLERIVKRYNCESECSYIDFQTPEHVGYDNYVARLSTAKLFTSVFLKEIKEFIRFDEYNVYIGHYEGKLYIRIS